MQNGWFAVWFDSPHYHQLYAHRSDAEAAGFIDALTARLARARIPACSISAAVRDGTRGIWRRKAMT